MAENFDGNPLIQAIDAKRKAAEEAAAAAPRVLSIKTRQAWEAPPAPADEPEAPADQPTVNKAAQKAVADLAEQVESGEVQAVIVVGIRADSSVYARIGMDGKDAEATAIRLLGAVDYAKGDLLEIADFGMEGDEDGALDDDEDDEP